MRITNQRGIALITTLLVMMLMSALLVGFTAVVMSDQRYRFVDRDRNQAFYAASGGIEKLTADLGNLFFTTLAPTSAQISVLTVGASIPVIPSVAFTTPMAAGTLPTSSLTRCALPNTVKSVGTKGYTIQFCAAATGNPTTSSTSPIKSGPYEGLIALQTPYQLDVTAKTGTGGEVHLIRTMEAVAIPVFQFGIFSEVDLSFFAGPDFMFGGRVHTNGNLFLSQGPGATLTLGDRVTAVKEVIREQLQNGASIDDSPSHDGVVTVALTPGATAPGAFRPLARNEGSVPGGIGSATAMQTLAWQGISSGAYNLMIRNGATGAKPLKLPLITAGGTNTDLIRRPPVGEDVLHSVLFNERLYAKASLRILLSDKAADITTLPTVTPTAPLLLDGDWSVPTGLPSPINGVAYGPVNALHPPIARTPGPIAIGVNGGSTAAVIHVANITSFLPVMTLKGSALVCGNKDVATLTLTCDVLTGAGIGDSIKAAGGISVPINSAVAAGPNKPIVVSAANAASFAAIHPRPFWVNDTLVSCTGWNDTPKQFTGCAGLTADPSNGDTLMSNGLSGPGVGTVGGYIKIEKQDVNGVWTDVTMDIMNRGIGGVNLAGTQCPDPTPDAILRIQRLRDNGGGACDYNTTTTGAGDATNWWPNVLFDPREGLLRDTNPGGTNVILGGLMYYSAIDATNLAKWFKGTAPYNVGVNGTNARTENGGYTVYFSDRRNNRDTTNKETGEYGSEDFVTANSTLDIGEDVNGDLTLQTYGSLPNFGGASGIVPPGGASPLDGTARPATRLTRGQAQVNRAILFRHALKLIHGSNIAGLGITGLTVVAENPVYIQGDWNANPLGAGGFSGAHAATAVIADAVTLLSENWNDTASFTSPYDIGGRNRGAQSWYRVALISGKGIAFPRPTGTESDFGTDGGAHNFLRYLENGDAAVNYLGSIASFYYNRQAVGTYKCCSTVYGAPDRNYSFDIDFLTPAKLPPNTPSFRDINTVGFAQELRPGR